MGKKIEKRTQAFILQLNLSVMFNFTDHLKDFQPKHNRDTLIWYILLFDTTMHDV